jgi:hypothetical protein
LDFASVKSVEGYEEGTKRYAKRGADVANVLRDGVEIVLYCKKPSKVVSGRVVLVHDSGINILDLNNEFGKFIKGSVESGRVVSGLVEGRKVRVGLIL